ncbi:MAG: hypothetical protein JNJ44_10060 [Zoogloeaceae bacterium]|nr:hypothetical protein [Zoogloeaceae bacterium]
MDGPSCYGWKLDIPGTFSSRQELSKAGDALYARFLKGEISPSIETRKEKFRGYRVVGSARFQALHFKWEPVLELRKVEEPNKGMTQLVSGRDTAFSRNLYSSSEGAAIFALEYGKRMVLGIVRGLEI